MVLSSVLAFVWTGEWHTPARLGGVRSSFARKSNRLPRTFPDYSNDTARDRRNAVRALGPDANGVRCGTLHDATGAGAWPARPVRIIVAYPPGGGIDTVVRVLAQKLTEQLGSSFVVENRPGSAGVLATEPVARAGNEYVMSSPEEFLAFVRAEIAKWTKVVKESNIRID